MSYTSIAAKLATILENVKNVGGSKLASYYTYENPQSDSTPFAQIMTGEAEETMLDTTTNEVAYRYKIRFIDINADKADMEATMRTLADQVLAELRKSTNELLGGEAVRFLPFKVTWGWDTGNQTPSRFFEVEMEAIETFDK